MWHNATDRIEYVFSKVRREIESNSKLPKRRILSISAWVFDPLTLISPIAVTAKILFQKLCVEQSRWDHPLPEDKSIRLKTLLCFEDLLDTRSIAIAWLMLDNINQ